MLWPRPLMSVPTCDLLSLDSFCGVLEGDNITIRAIFYQCAEACWSMTCKKAGLKIFLRKLLDVMICAEVNLHMLAGTVCFG